MSDLLTSDNLDVRGGFPPDFQSDEIAIINAVGPYTMTSAERIHALIRAVNHIVNFGIAGALIECGVWKGGSVMAMALTLLQLQNQQRALYLFDTFAGMTAPDDRDIDYLGRPARMIIDENICLASQEETEAVMYSTGYDREKIHFVNGPVEQTLPSRAPEAISLLRLDTDWYGSTRHSLTHLFPRLVPGGILIIDDYGHWQGARRAVDEYFAENRVPLLLHRIDYTGRIGVKP
jgi:hypothetical protein